jgi:hypothetical protein
MDDWYSRETDKLKEAEKAAAEKPQGAEDSLGSLKGLEENAKGFYSGSGKTFSGKGGKKVNLKAKGFLKKGGPMIAITGIITAVGGLMMGAQTLMPVAISEMIIEKFNSIGISSTMTSDAWLDTQLNYGVRLENLETGQTENLFAFSEYQVQQFESQNIKVIDNIGGGTTQITALLYEKNGLWIPVVGSDVLSYSGFSEDDLINAIRVASGIDNIGTPVSATVALSDSDFKTPYTTASKSWRGGASGWFDEMMSRITETKLSINRNRWARYAAKSLGQMTEEFKATAASAEKKNTTDYEVNAEKTMSSEEYEASGLREGSTFVPSESDSDGWSSNGNPNGEVMTVVEVIPNPIYDDNGEIVDYTYTVKGNNNNATVNDATDISSLESSLTSKAMKAAGAAASGAEVTCAVVEGLMSIYTVVSAYQSLQFLNVISGFLESVDKVKAGDGDNSPVHEYSNNLTTVAPTVTSDENGNEEVVAEKTAMESAGMSWLFSDTPMNSNDASVSNVNFESIMSNMSVLTSNISITAKAFETCGYVKVGTAITNLVLTGMSFIPLAGQAITFTQVAVSIAKDVVISAAVQTFFYVAIPVIARKVINSIIKDAATEWFGEDLGNAIISGASKYLGGNGTSGGQGPGSESKVIAYLTEQQSVIAQEAEYQRSIRSPFDITSPYTFLGSLAYSILPLSYSSSGVLAAITKVSSLTTSSITSLLPTADAIGVNDSITSTGDCPLLEGVGAVGDAYCNPYIITDTATVNSNPDSIETKVHQMTDSKGVSNFNADGTINEKSDLAKYITYCGQRTSQYGLKDSSIVEGLSGEVEQEESSGGFGSWISQLIGMLPVLGDTQSILESINDAGLLQWTTGEACVVSDENEFWEDNQYYQRYAENQRLLENMNPDYKSTVTAYLEEYYEENPVDDSFEGQLARFAGMSKEKVEDTLALIDYYQFLDEYDASTRYAFNVKEEKKEVEIEYENENEIAYLITGILPRYVVYADVRNRQTIVV